MKLRISILILFLFLFSGCKFLVEDYSIPANILNGTNTSLNFTGTINYNNYEVCNTNTCANAYGHMTNDLGDTIIIPQANVWVEANTTYTNWTKGYTKQITLEEDHYLKILSPGIYLVDVSAALEGSTAGDTIGVSAGLNNVPQMSGHSHSTISNPNNQVGMATSYILNLSVNDEISLMVVNHVAGRDLQIIHSSITITRIGG
jgi:hypothetical protein